MDFVRNIITTLFARVLVLALALTSSVLLARLLGPEGRGLFALVLLLPELARSFALLGFDQGNALYAGLEAKGRRALVWHSAVLAGVIGGLVATSSIGYVIFGAPGFQTLIRGPLWLYLLPLSIIPGRLVVEYWGAILRGMNHIFLLNMVEVGSKIASLALVVILLGWLRLDVAGVVWADSMLHVGMVLLMIALLRYAGVWGKPSFDHALWQRTRRFALPVYCASILTYLHYRIDQFIVAALLTPQELGFYVIAVDLAERLWIVNGAVANVLLPHLTNSQERDPTLAAVVSRHGMLWTGMACLLLFGLADTMVRLLYSSAFAEVVAPLRWILPGIFIRTLGQILVAELMAREKAAILVRVSALGTAVNIVGNLVLVPSMGISGAALASSISYSLISLSITWYYLRETGVSWTMLLPRWHDLLVYAALWRRLSHVTPLEHRLS